MLLVTSENLTLENYITFSTKNYRTYIVQHHISVVLNYGTVTISVFGIVSLRGRYIGIGVQYIRVVSNISVFTTLPG